MRRKKPCLDCDKPVNLGSVRCPICARKGPLNPKWGKFTATTNRAAGMNRARHRFALEACILCGQPAFERHHIDGNDLNNEPTNVQPLCRRCHMASDGRLECLIERNRKGRKYRDNAEKFRALRARRKAEGRPIRKKNK